MCERGKSYILPTPEWLWNERNNPEAGISVDYCIAFTISYAWLKGVKTLGSCCGHGVEPPNVVLTQDHEQISLAKEILPNWTLYQWQLVKVNEGVKERRVQDG